MAEPRRDLKKPFVTPPVGSRLFKIVEHFAQAADEPTLVRLVQEKSEGVVAAWLVKSGAPQDLVSARPPWLQPYLDIYVEKFEQAFFAAKSGRKRSSGRPSYPNAYPAAVGLAVFERHRQKNPHAADHAIFEAVAVDLGPGITKHHVRRLVQSHRRRLGVLRLKNPQDAELADQAVASTLTLLDEFETRSSRPCAETSRKKPI